MKSAAEVTVDVPGAGPLLMDVTSVGNFYAVVELHENRPGLDVGSLAIVAFSQRLRMAWANLIDPVHSDDGRIWGVHLAIWCELGLR